MMGLAASPGTEVLPMCSTASNTPSGISSARAAAARTGQASSYSTTSITERPPSCPASDERAQAGNGAAHDQRVDLAGALVGVDRLGIGHEPAHVILQQDAIPAEQLARPANRLPHPDRAERLGQRGVVIFGQVRLLQRGQPGA